MDDNFDKPGQFLHQRSYNDDFNDNEHYYLLDLNHRPYFRLHDRSTTSSSTTEGPSPADTSIPAITSCTTSTLSATTSNGSTFAATGVCMCNDGIQLQIGEDTEKDGVITPTCSAPGVISTTFIAGPLTTIAPPTTSSLTIIASPTSITSSTTTASPTTSTPSTTSIDPFPQATGPYESPYPVHCGVYGTSVQGTLMDLNSISDWIAEFCASDFRLTYDAPNKQLTKQASGNGNKFLFEAAFTYEGGCGTRGPQNSQGYTADECKDWIGQAINDCDTGTVKQKYGGAIAEDCTVWTAMAIHGT
ncbi:hypothetical protein LTR09_005900 [Extremus antarcticus]|uniref:Uncharacterized protein n=1 Tax=Extremus antarcticus TaxID=702011 RepID=A0AAJ0DFG3_9PEZI|nr:hypothetical protein LTR09_005900 [Extremus antarcticus]